MSREGEEMAGRRGGRDGADASGAFGAEPEAFRRSPPFSPAGRRWLRSSRMRGGAAHGGEVGPSSGPSGHLLPAGEKGGGHRSVEGKSPRGRHTATLALLGLLLAGPAGAADLVVAGSTDRAAMAPLLEAFAAARPDLDVVYLDDETVDLYEGVRSGTIEPAPDLVISSAADLQIRLVNDGFTRRWSSEATARLPDVARWRDEAFGFTVEPLVFVVNPRLLPPDHRPATREALARLVRAGGVDGPRVATYDVGQSGIGYLAASYDAETMSDYWPFVEAISNTGLLTACCTADVLDMVAEGRALVGYNVLGSYARARAEADPRVVVVEPEDFTVVIARVAVIPKSAPHPEAAGAFLDFLLSPAGQALLGPEAILGPEAAGGGAATARGPVRSIPLGASLLAVTDPLRRRQFIGLWRSVTGGVP